MNSKIKLSLCAAVVFLAAHPALSSASAQSSVRLFGVLDEGLVLTNQKKNTAGVKKTTNVAELRSGVYRGARWGITGREDLGGGYSVGFMLDAGFRDDDGGQTMNRLFGRQATLDMKGPFGEVYLGRIGAIMSAAGPMAVAGWYTPFGSSCGKYAVTAYNYMFNFQRLDNSVSYRSPKIGNVRLLAQVSSDVNTLEDLDSATDGIQHGTEWKDSTGHYYGVGLQYDAKNVNFNFGADRLTYSRTLQGTKPKDSYNVTGGGFVTLDKFKVYAGAQLFSHATSKWILTYNQIWGGSRYLKGYAVMGGVGYKLWGGELLGAAGYSRAENASGSPKLMNRTYGVSVGYEYPITKRTSFYLMVNGNYSTLKENGKLPSRASTLESTMGLSHFF